MATHKCVHAGKCNNQKPSCLKRDNNNRTCTKVDLSPQATCEAVSAELALLCAEIGPLVAKLAQWERDNGTLACILGAEQKEAVCEIISDWALTGAMRRCDEWIKSGT